MKKSSRFEDSNINDLIYQRDLLGAFEIAENNDNFDEKEQLKLIYGNNIALIKQLLGEIENIQKSGAVDYDDLEIRRKLLYSFVNSFSARETEAYGQSEEALENYFYLLIANAKNKMAENPARVALNFDISYLIYLIKFTLNLKFLFNYTENKKLKGKAIEYIQANDLSGAINENINSLKFIITIDNLLNAAVKNKDNISYTSGKIADKNEVHHQIADLCIQMLKNYKDIRDLGLYTEEPLLDFLNEYFSNQIKEKNRYYIGYQKHSLVESMICFSEIYYKKDYFQLSGLSVIDSIWADVEKELSFYFNLLLPNEIIIVKKRGVFFLSNQFNNLSDIFFKIGDGETAVLMKLVANLFDDDQDSALEIIRNQIYFFNDFKFPSYIDDRLYSIQLITFINYYAQFEEFSETKKGYVELVNEIEGFLDKFLTKNISQLLLSGIIKNEPGYRFEGRFRFGLCPNYLQAHLVMRILRIGTKDDSFIESWGQPAIGNLIFDIGDCFGRELGDHFALINNSFEFSIDLSAVDSYKIDPVLDSFWRFLSQISAEEMEKIFENKSCKAKIASLARTTIQLSRNYNAVDGVFRFANFWHNNKEMVDSINGCNKSAFNSLCKVITINVKSYYERLPLYYWKPRHRNIVDEINVFQNSLQTPK